MRAASSWLNQTDEPSANHESETTLVPVSKEHGRRLVRSPIAERLSLAEGDACHTPPAERLAENGQVVDPG